MTGGGPTQRVQPEQGKGGHIGVQALPYLEDSESEDGEDEGHMSLPTRLIRGERPGARTGDQEDEDEDEDENEEDDEDEDYEALGRMTVKARSEAFVQVMRGAGAGPAPTATVSASGAGSTQATGGRGTGAMARPQHGPSRLGSHVAGPPLPP